MQTKHSSALRRPLLDALFVTMLMPHCAGQGRSQRVSTLVRFVFENMLGLDMRQTQETRQCSDCASFGATVSAITCGTTTASLAAATISKLPVVSQTSDTCANSSLSPSRVISCVPARTNANPKHMLSCEKRSIVPLMLFSVVSGARVSQCRVLVGIFGCGASARPFQHCGQRHFNPPVHTTLKHVRTHSYHHYRLRPVLFKKDHP